jgi:surface protein
MKNSNAKSVNNIISLLLTRTTDSPGTINITGIDDLNQVNTEVAESKFWRVIYLIAQYKFDKSIYDNLIPEFNAEFTNYEIEDEYLDTEDIVVSSTETMMLMSYDAEPDEYGILTTEYEVENVNTFSAENIVTRYIYNNNLPTLMKFGSKSGGSDSAYALIELTYAKVDELTTMGSMFDNCINIVSCNTEGWNTSKVTNMVGMFSTCNKLTSLDLSSFDTINVTDMRYMFNSCKKLTTIGDVVIGMLVM